MKIKRAYQIADHITMGIFRLPIVTGIRKVEGKALYLLQRYWDEKDNPHKVLYSNGVDCFCAFQGQWLCELDSGDWMVFTDEEYNALYKPNKNKGK